MDDRPAPEPNMHAQSEVGAVPARSTAAPVSPSVGGERPAQPKRRPRRGDRFTLQIERIDEKGRGHALHEAEQFALRHANPGSSVESEVLGRKGRRVDARVVATLDPGPHTVAARCPHAGVCGGCALPTLDYAEQLVQMRGIVERALEGAYSEAGLGEPPTVQDVVAAEALEGYRNKMDFTFGSRRYVLAGEPQGVDASFGLGLHAPGLYQKVLDITHCAIAFDGASAIVNDARELAREQGLAPWDLKAHTGLLRHLVLRRGVRTDQTMINLVTSERAAERIDHYVAELLDRHPTVTTVVQNLTTKLATVAYGEEEFVLHGPGTIDEILGGKRFRISADSFFQTNTVQAERLFEMVAEAAALEPGQRLYDVYCGAGTIGLAIAPEGTRIVGFESAPTAVRDARQNARMNGVEDAVYHEGDVLETLRLEAESNPPDVIVVDPPRAGLHPKVPAQLADLGASRIVLVSCNPKTGARDVVALAAAGYELQDVRPIDLFPHTPHVEVVFRLEKRT